MNPSLDALKAARTIWKAAITTAPLTRKETADVIQAAIDAALAAHSTRVVIQVNSGCVSRVLASQPNLDVEILDMDVRDEGQIDSEDAERNEAEIDADLKAGKLVKIA